MEIKMMYPQIIAYALLASLLLLFVWRRKKRYRKGILVANTKYIKKSGYFRFLNAKYHLYNILIKALCILSIFTASFLTTRLYKEDVHNEEYFNRDIMLCLDVSGSVWNLDKDIINTFIDVVATMKDQRFGLTMFDSTPVTAIPITNDYDYAIESLKVLSASFDNMTNMRNSSVGMKYSTYYQYKQYYEYLFAGTREVKGSSLIGDGLAYCSSTFSKDKERTKVVILATDNMSGKGIFTTSEAGEYSKENDVKVYTIGVLPKSNTQTTAIDELKTISKNTGGEYYEYGKFATNDISKKIDELDKTAIIKESFVTRQDLPQIVFPYLLFMIPILFVLDWRVRI